MGLSEAGKRRTPEYATWANIIGRCGNQKNPAYKWYGAKGVRVCDRWRHDYATFLADMGRRPSAKHSIDRFPDPTGEYGPGNCRWATMQEQQRNRRNNRHATIGGVKKTLVEWSEVSGVKLSTLALRLRSGTSPERAINPTPIRNVLVTYEGETMTVSELARRTGIPDNSLKRRLDRHGDVSVAIAAWHANGKGKKPCRKR